MPPEVFKPGDILLIRDITTTKYLSKYGCKQEDVVICKGGGYSYTVIESNANIINWYDPYTLTLLDRYEC